ncbi:MAG: B12-binding domain-containing radical SAM protein [Oscillospiraceae bacterium]|nr:B12-binding domain-containing radical SAM protein [Oscillospiraceae bacterium]
MTKVDVILISPPAPSPSVHLLDKAGTPPIGLGYLATCLAKEGFKVRIIDLAIPSKNIETIISAIKENKPKIVGISTATETYKTTVRIANEIKKISTNCDIVFGGYHASFEYATVLKENAIDYVVLNEGEISFTNLCKFLIRGVGDIEAVRGIVYKKNGDIICTTPEPFIENLDILPILDRSHFEDAHEYTHFATVSTSRGCPGKCIFCAASVLSGGRHRMRSAKSIIEEFELLKEKGFENVYVVDDTMTANTRRLNEFLDMLIKKNLQMTWFCESRVDILSYELLRKMRRAGLTGIQVGAESGSQEILDSVNKGITLAQVHNVFKWCKELEVSAATNLIIGQPTDTRETIQETIRMAHDLTSLGAQVTFSVSTPFPGTPMWIKPGEFGMKIIDFDLSHYNAFCPVFNTRHLTAAEIRNEYYLAVKKIDKAQRKNKIDSDGNNLDVHSRVLSSWFE